MRRALPALLLVAVLALTGCSGGSGSDTPEAVATSAEPAGFSAGVRSNFLISCVENATSTSQGAATQEQLSQTCECILGKVEQEYTEAEFTEFERRLLAGEASDEESRQLTEWSTGCAEEATG